MIHPSSTPAARGRFAHRSEQVFASLLDASDIHWEYEPVEFALAWDDNGTPIRGFRPDFWLPDYSIFVEMTVADQKLITRKNAKVRQMRELYPEVGILVVYQRDFFLLLDHHGIDFDLAKVA